MLEFFYFKKVNFTRTIYLGLCVNSKQVFIKNNKNKQKEIYIYI